MARNHNFFFDQDGSPRARGPASEKVLMTFLEVDVQGSDHICHDLMEDLTAIEDESDDSREFIGNAHSVTITPDGVVIDRLHDGKLEGDDESAADQPYTVPLKHFREILEDWEAFILDDQLDDPMLDDELLS